MPGLVRAETVEAARQLYLDADFRRAEEAFEEVLRDPEIDDDEASTAHVFLATLALMFGDEDSARYHADAAFSIDASIELPEGAPLRAQEILEEQRELARGPVAELQPPDGSEPDATSHDTVGAPQMAADAEGDTSDHSDHQDVVLDDVLDVVPPDDDVQDEQRRRRSPWIWVGVSAIVVAVVTGIVLGVTLGNRDIEISEVHFEGW